MTQQHPAPAPQPERQPSPQAPGGYRPVPHRGPTVLVLGILGLIMCCILGIIAWVMGSKDLRAMDAGEMDPAGRGLTQAGKILGMVSVVFWVLVLGICLLVLLGLALAAAL